MNSITTSPVSFNDGAVKEIKKLLSEATPGQHLRVGVKGGGCSGMTYVLGFDSKQEDDLEYESEGFTFLMNPTHELYLAGMEINWEGGINSRGFTFKNPNANTTCGCGTSFGVK